MVVVREGVLMGEMVGRWIGRGGMLEKGYYYIFFISAPVRLLLGVRGRSGIPSCQ